MTNLAQAIFQQYQHKKILILGFGREGRSTFRLLQEIFAIEDLAIMDELSDLQDQEKLPAGLKVMLGPTNYLQALSDYQVIFKTPSLSIKSAELQVFVEQGGVVSSQLNEFLKVYHRQTIGVTGTKGKSTTTAFIYQLLNQAGRPTLLAGNIGIPPFEIETELSDQKLIAMEMSSYQLETITVSPHWAIWLNFFPEHLNYHGTLGHYASAKAKITAFQTANDFFIGNVSIPAIKTASENSLAQKKPFSVFPTLASTQAKIGDFAAPQLSDIFLREDLPAVWELAKLFEIPASIISQTLANFQPLPHRLEKIMSANGVVFIDDTLATIPEAAVAAIRSLPPIQVILLGGFDRGIAYDLVVDEVVKKKIPMVILFRPSGEKMRQLFERKYSFHQRPKIFFADEMKVAVELCYQHAKTGEVVLLSPASPSYGQFKDYQDKSAQFKHWITKLAPAHEY